MPSVSVPIIGHSFGGMLAAELAATNPARVSKLVLISPISLGRDGTPIQNWMIITPTTYLPKYLFYHPSGSVAQKVLGLLDDPQQLIEAQIHFHWSLACTDKLVWPIPDKGLRKRIHRIKARPCSYGGKRTSW